MALQRLKNFKIYNKYGEVEFLEEMNTLGLDIDSIVRIEHKNVQFLDKDAIANRYGFNKPVKVTMKEFEVSNKSEDEARTLILRMLHRISADFIDYDFKNKILVYRFNVSIIY